MDLRLNQWNRYFCKQCQSLCFLLLIFLLPSFVGYVGYRYAGTFNHQTAIAFNAENAAYHLKKLTDIGPRVVGTFENEYEAVRLILRIFENILRNETSSKRHNTFDFDVQTASGCLVMKGKVYRKLSCYRNIKNVVAVVRPESGRYNESILVNCHFDTVPTSPGASDNGLNCAIMLEIMNMLIHSSRRVTKNIIFLYNGAEEVGLLGSHAFITQHQWSKRILCFVNLDACGAGGRQILFQTGPEYFKLVEVFATYVNDPHATVIGEELFQSGLIPSDTDFRIFRDFGNLKGLDLAHYTNGYVYHTKNDDMNQINDWIIKHTGDNLVSLIYGLMNSIEVDYDESTSNAVYFDFFGYMIFMTDYAALVYQSLTVICSFVIATYQLIILKPSGSPIKHWVKHLSAVSVILVLSYVTALIYSISVHFILAELQSTMLWFNDWTIIVLLYFIPTISIMCIPFIKYRSIMPNPRMTRRHILKFMYVIQLIWTCLLLFGTVTRIRSSYVLMLYVWPITVRASISSVNYVRHTESTQIILTCLVHLLNFFYVEYLAFQFYDLIIPITGRLGTSMNPEFVVGLLSVFICMVMFSLYIPLVLYFKHTEIIRRIITIAILSVVIVTFKSFQNPFGEKTPQRFTIIHCEFDSTAIVNKYNYIIYPMDHRGAETLNTLDIYNSYNKDYLCEELFCGMPLISLRSISSLDHITIVDTRDPVPIQQTPSLTYKKDTFKSGRMDLMNISITSRDFSNVEFVFAPHKSVKIERISLLNDDTPPPVISWKGKEAVFMTRHCGVRCYDDWNFTVTLRVPEQFNGPFHLKIAKCNHFTEDRNTSTAFKRFLGGFPKWSVISSWMSIYQQYVV